MERSKAEEYVDGLSPTAQDYLKTIWSATEWGEPPLGSKKLADRFGTSTANATETVKRLAAQGLVDYQAYQPVTLTEKGRALAIEMVRRHRLIETFLMTTLDYSWDEVHEEAERLEHAVTPRMVERIDMLLGHPTHDPHGDPIPDAEGNTAHTASARRLEDAPTGTPVVVLRVSDVEPDDLRLADEIGIFPGTLIELTSSDPLTALVDGRTVELPAAIAHAAWVVRPDED